MITIYYARWVLCEDFTILDNGAIVVENDTILEVGPRGRITRPKEARLVNAGNVLLMPGLINLHTHLEESVVRGMGTPEEESFATGFAKKRNRLRIAGDADVASAVRLCIREMISHGITTIVDSSRRLISPMVLAAEPVRSCAMIELNPHTANEEQEVMDSIENAIEAIPKQVAVGLNPYAIFSLSPSNHRRLFQIAHEKNLPWATHMAESAEELQAFSEQGGDLYFHITRNKEWAYGNNPMGSLNFSLVNSLIPNKGILYHCNYANGNELKLLAPKNIFVAVSMLYTKNLGHKRLPLDIALQRGLSLCAVTESVADSGNTSLFEELYALKTRYPHIESKQLLRWVTENPARALRMFHKIGSLSAGKYADIIGIRFSHSAGAHILDEIILEEPEVAMVVIGGEEVIVDW